MSAYLPELDTPEQEQTAAEMIPPDGGDDPSSPAAPPPQYWQQLSQYWQQQSQYWQQQSRSQDKNTLSKVSLAVSILALILSCAVLFLVLRPAEAEEPAPPPAPEPVVEEPVTFRFGDYVLTPLEGMPLNPYERAGFTVDGRGRVSYEKDGKRARTGIDVSAYQGEIDWTAVAADGIDFAILRLGYRGYTEGGLFMDQTFEANLRGALDAGLDVGVYFFSQAITPQEAEAEAAFVLNAIGDYKLTYPIAFDWESISPGSAARTDGLDNDTLTQCANAFCAKIRGAGYTPAVYFNQTQGYLRYDLRELTEYDLWLAEYDTDPDFYYHFDLWQYTHTGRVNGIQGDVDMDLDLR